MKFYVSDISFDFSDNFYELSKDEKIDIIDDSLGIWEADDDEHLIEVITEATGYTVRNLSISNVDTHKLSHVTDYELSV